MMDEGGRFFLDEESTEVVLTPLATDLDAEDDLSTVIDASARWEAHRTQAESQATAMDPLDVAESSQQLTDTGPAPRSPRRAPLMSDAYAYLARAACDRGGALVLDRTPGGTPLSAG